MTPPPESPTATADASFADLFGEAYGKLCAVAAACVTDRVEAEDLVQDAALVGLRKFADFRPGTSFVAWMSQIVRLHASNWRHKQARRKTLAADPVDIDRANAVAESATQDAAAGDESLDAARRGELGPLRDSFDDRVVAAFGRLAETPRACLLLRIVHQMTYDEIGDAIGVPAGTAMSHVHRSRARLRKELASTTGVEHG